MRILRTALIVAGGVLSLSACNPNFDAEEANNKKEILNSREEVTIRLATASEAAGDLGGAERMYLQLSKGGSLQSIIDLASFYCRHAQQQRAVELLEQAYGKHPTEATVQRSLANAFIAAGAPDRAIAILDEALLKNPGEPYLYNSRGVALDNLERYADAQDAYRKALALAPEHEMDFKTNLSMSHILSGDYSAAIKLLQPLLGHDNVVPEVRQNLALAYGLSGNIEKAKLFGGNDLSAKEMDENIRFYRVMAQKKRHSVVASAMPEPLPPPEAPAKESARAPFTEADIASQDGTAKAEPSAEKPVVKSEKPAAATPATTMPVETLSPSAGGTSATSLAFEDGKIPLPTLKPDKW